MRALISVTLLVVLLPACSQVKPWEKGNFTKAQMSFEPDPLEARFKQHVYFSKEGSSGGYGLAGGGCGCN